MKRPSRPTCGRLFCSFSTDVTRWDELYVSIWLHEDSALFARGWLLTTVKGRSWDMIGLPFSILERSN
jgi:hypothetical protein